MLIRLTLDTDIAQEMHKDGINPDMLILGSKAANMLLQNERYLKLLDNRRVESGEKTSCTSKLANHPGELKRGAMRV